MTVRIVHSKKLNEHTNFFFCTSTHRWRMNANRQEQDLTKKKINEEKRNGDFHLKKCARRILYQFKESLG